jgi:hypothetical protein
MQPLPHIGRALIKHTTKNLYFAETTSLFNHSNRVMMLITLCLSVFLFWFYMLGPCFCGLLIIAHAALRPQSVASKGTVKADEYKSKAADMVAKAKERAKLN